MPRRRRTRACDPSTSGHFSEEMRTKPHVRGARAECVLWLRPLSARFQREIWVESRGIEPGGFASELPNTSSLIEDPLGRPLAVLPPNPLQTVTVVKTETRVLYLTETYKKLALELLHVAFLCDDLDLVLLLTDRRDRFQ